MLSFEDIVGLACMAAVLSHLIVEIVDAAYRIVRLLVNEWR